MLGSLIAGGLNYLGARSANSANRGMANAQMGFQADMSNTSYQRAVADMRAAGINPMLAYSQGGASTPSGASIQQQNEVAPAVSSALDAKRQRAEIKNLEEQNHAIKSQKKLLDAQTLSTSNSAKATELSLPGLANDAAIDASKAGHYLRWYERLLGPISDTVKMSKPGTQFNFHK